MRYSRADWGFEKMTLKYQPRMYQRKKGATKEARNEKESSKESQNRDVYCCMILLGHQSSAHSGGKTHPNSPAWFTCIHYASGIVKWLIWASSWGLFLSLLSFKMLSFLQGTTDLSAIRNGLNENLLLGEYQMNQRVVNSFQSRLINEGCGGERKL